MNAIISDPDTKINMSLDDIIRLTHNKANVNQRGKKMKNKHQLLKDDHSVPLLTSSEGVSIFVSKKSPLLTPEIKSSFLKAVRNRSLNAELLRKSSRVIPAKYELIKTDNGVERVLVPVKNYVCKPLRKLHHATIRNHSYNKKWHDEIPPLVCAPVLKPAHSPFHQFKQNTVSKMEVDDDDDDDVVVIGPVKKEPEVIDVEMNSLVSTSDSENSGKAKTLNHRFTRLTGQLQF